MTLDDVLVGNSRQGNLEEVKRVIEKGADIHAYNDDLALRWASLNGHLEVVKYLCEHGADIHAEDDDALRCASLNGHTKVVKYLESRIFQEKRIAGLEKLKCL